MRLAQRQPDGTTRRENLLAVSRPGGMPHWELLEQAPVGGELLFETYLDLRGTSGAGLNGANPLAPSELEAWARLQGLALTPWEVDTLLAMGRAAGSVAARTDASPTP